MDTEISHLLRIIKSCSQEACKAVLGLDLTPEEPWVLVSRVENTCEFGAMVGFANDHWFGACTLGISAESAESLLPHLSEELIFDVLGELGNNLCGSLSSEPEFTAIYGILEQTPPLFSRNSAWLAKSEGVQGNMTAQGHNVFVGCTLRSRGGR